MAIEEIAGLQVDLDRLPDHLRELGPMIRRWAIGDEDEREQQHEAASTEELAAYWLSVSQAFPAISAFLDETIESERSNEAVVLGLTAEGALEAADVIERRTGTAPGGDSTSVA